MTSAPTLETPRLRLRAHRMTDLAVCLALRAEPEVFRMTSGRPLTKEEIWLRILSYVGLWALRGFGAWAIEEKATGTFIGEVGFSDARRDGMESAHGVPEAGWWLASTCQGWGYGTEVVRAIHDWSDAHLLTGYTVCSVRPKNQASISLAHRIGYRYTEELVYREFPLLLFERGIRPVEASVPA
jgi:RimJ/RimL family protein N-acetyltransferase